MRIVRRVFFKISLAIHNCAEFLQNFSTFSKFRLIFLKISPKIFYIPKYFLRFVANM